jgi:hypothetical protein
MSLRFIYYSACTWTMDGKITTIYTLIVATPSALVALFTTSSSEALVQPNHVVLSNKTTTSNTTTTATSNDKSGTIESVQLIITLKMLLSKINQQMK